MAKAVSAIRRRERAREKKNSISHELTTSVILRLAHKHKRRGVGN